MLRTLFIINDLAAGGAELSLLELLRHLDRTVIAPRLFLLERSGVHLDGIPSDVDLSWGRRDGTLKSHLSATVLSAIRQGGNTDIIVGAMEGMPSYLAWLVGSLLRKPVACWVKTDLEHHLARAQGWQTAASRWIYPALDAVVAPSRGSLRSIERAASVASDRLHLIHNPVDVERVARSSAHALPEPMAHLLHKPFVLAVGRLNNDQKGFDRLIDAHAAVRASGIDHNLVILGEGPDREFLEQKVRSLGVEDSTHMPGFVDEPFPFYNAARLFAAPAPIDGFGRVYLEAMACGLPVIGSQASGPLEILDDGRYGIIIPSGDADALGLAISGLLTDEEMHARYATLSRQRAAFYRPQDVARQWEALLLTVAKRT